MIAFGTAVTDRARYERCAAPGIERCAESDSVLLTRSGLPLQRAYNEIMTEAAARPELEALALLHQDLELTDDSLPGRARRAFRDPAVGLLGALGARGIEPHVWPAPSELYGTFAEPSGERRFSTGPHRVDGVDGVLLVLAPWVVRNLRFDERLADGFHGYDVDMNMRVGAYGGGAVCDDIPYFHHREPSTDFDAQRRAGVELARMWSSPLRPRQWNNAFRR